MHPSGRTSLTTLSGNYRQLIGWGLTCTVLQKYAATQKMTGNEQARSGHFCLCGYGAKAPLTAKAVISGAGLQPCLVIIPSEFGVGLRSRPRIAQQVPGPSGPLSAKNDPLDHFSGAPSPKKPGDGRWSLLQSDGSWVFHGPRRLFAVPYKLNWRKLLVSVFKLVRPLGCKG